MTISGIADVIHEVMDFSDNSCTITLLGDTSGVSNINMTVGTSEGGFDIYDGAVPVQMTHRITGLTLGAKYWVRFYVNQGTFDLFDQYFYPVDNRVFTENAYVARDKKNSATLFATNQVTGFEASNLLDPDLTRRWKADSNNTTVIVDFQKPELINCLGLVDLRAVEGDEVQFTVYGGEILDSPHLDDSRDFTPKQIGGGLAAVDGSGTITLNPNQKIIANNKVGFNYLKNYTIEIFVDSHSGGNAYLNDNVAGNIFLDDEGNPLVVEMTPALTGSNGGQYVFEVRVPSLASYQPAIYTDGSATITFSKISIRETAPVFFWEGPFWETLYESGFYSGTELPNFESDREVLVFQKAMLQKHRVSSVTMVLSPVREVESGFLFIGEYVTGQFRSDTDWSETTKDLSRKKRLRSGILQVTKIAKYNKLNIKFSSLTDQEEDEFVTFFKRVGSSEPVMISPQPWRDGYSERRTRFGVLDKDPSVSGVAYDLNRVQLSIEEVGNGL